MNGDKAGRVNNTLHMRLIDLFRGMVQQKRKVKKTKKPGKVPPCHTYHQKFMKTSLQFQDTDSTQFGIFSNLLQRKNQKVNMVQHLTKCLNIHTPQGKQMHICLYIHLSFYLFVYHFSICFFSSNV